MKELQEKIRVRAIEHKYSKTSDLISISQGICYGIPTDYVMVWEYLHQADEMLYRVKETEKGGIRLGHYAKGNE